MKLAPKIALAVVGVFALSNVAQAASVSGMVKWKGKAPKLRTIKMNPECDAKYAGKAKPKSQALVLGSGNAMGNVLVYVKSGLPKKDWPTPKEDVKVDQSGCNYEPHVFAVQKKQKITFLNSDGILHNVHALPKKNRQFNISMPANMKESRPKKFRKVEAPFKVKCDVHPWMLSWVGVFDHPFFAVTGPDGKFKIDGLPAGTYEVEAWHEKAGTRTAKLTVGESDSKSTSFTFSR